MIAFFNQEAPGHDSDDVRVLDGGEAMGDDNAGTAFSSFVQGFLYDLRPKQIDKRSERKSVLLSHKDECYL